MDFVAITSCPAKELGLDAKVEQQGAMGLKNEITPEEAQTARFLLIGSDQKIEKMERFKGKPAMRVDINMCIKKPKAVIQKCLQAVEKLENK